MCQDGVGGACVCIRAHVCQRRGDPEKLIGASEPALWEEGQSGVHLKQGNLTPGTRHSGCDPGEGDV